MEPFWDDDVRYWVDDRIEHAGPFDRNCVAMGVEHEGKTVAGFVFHNYDPRAGLIECSGASEHPRWANRKVLNVAMDYVFRVAGCQMLYARQHIENEAPRRTWIKMGAFETEVPRLMGRDTMGTIIWLADDAWYASKFYWGNHGRR